MWTKESKKLVCHFKRKNTTTEEGRGLIFQRIKILRIWLWNTNRGKSLQIVTTPFKFKAFLSYRVSPVPPWENQKKLLNACSKSGCAAATSEKQRNTQCEKVETAKSTLLKARWCQSRQCKFISEIIIPISELYKHLQRESSTILAFMIRTFSIAEIW